MVLQLRLRGVRVCTWRKHPRGSVAASGRACIDHEANRDSGRQWAHQSVGHTLHTPRHGAHSGHTAAPEWITGMGRAEGPQWACGA